MLYMNNKPQNEIASKNIATVINEAKKLSYDLFKNPPFLAMSVMFIMGKIAVNFYMGAKITTALRSGVLGYILYFMAFYCVHFFTAHVGSPKAARTVNKTYAIVLISWVIITIGILSLTILHKIEFIRFEIPLWGELNNYWENIVNGLAQRYTWIERIGLVGWPYLILYLLIPLILAFCYRIKLPHIIGWKKAIAALPFVLLYFIGFVFIKGISGKSISTLLAVLIWPAFGEEFLYRGVLQQAFLGVVKKPITAIVLSSVLFALSHVPIYVFAASGPVVLGWSALLPIMMMSFFWGYGVYRTGVLWPWVFIHAVSDLIVI